MSSLLSLILLTCLVQVCANVQAKSIKSDLDENVEKLFAYKNDNNVFDPEKTLSILSALVSTDLSKLNHVGAVTSRQNIEALIEASKPSLEKCNIPTIANLNGLKESNANYDSLRVYLGHHLRIQVDKCEQEFSKLMRRQLDDIPVEEKRQALDKIDVLNRIIRDLLRDQSVNLGQILGGRERYYAEDQGRVNAAMSSNNDDEMTILVDMLHGISTDTFKHALAIYLSRLGVVLYSDDAEKANGIVNKEFSDTIAIVQRYLSELMRFYKELKRAEPRSLKGYDESLIKTMVNLDIVDRLATSGDFGGLVKWAPERKGMRAILSKLCNGAKCKK